MEDFLTKQNKFDLVDRECRRSKDTDGMIKWDDCVLLIEKILPNSSMTKVKRLLSNADEQGLGQIESDVLKGIINDLLTEENSKDKHDSEEELPDEEEEQERKSDLLEELYKMAKKDGQIKLESIDELAEKHKVKLGK